MYEVHVEDESGSWTHSAQFDVLEQARIEAVHLIRHSPARRVRVVHVVEYYTKPPDTAGSEPRRG
jgi:hypothetical protein